MEKYYWGFPLSEELQQRCMDMAKKIRQSDNKRQYALEAYDIIYALSDVGLDHFFLRPTKMAKIGRLKVMAIEKALKTGKKVILSVGKSIIKGLSEEQMLVIAQCLEEAVVKGNPVAD